MLRLLLALTLLLATQSDFQSQRSTHPKYRLASIAYNPDGSRIIISDFSGTRWEYDSGSLTGLAVNKVLAADWPTASQLYDFTDSTLPYWRISPDKLLLLQWKTDGHAKIWHIEQETLIYERPSDIDILPLIDETQLYWAADSRHLMVCFQFTSLDCIPESIETGEQGASIPIGELPLMFSPDGRYFIAANGLYDAYTFQIAQPFEGDLGGTIPVWSADGRRIAFPSYYILNIRVYDLDEKRVTHEFYGRGRVEGERRAAWSPDGRYLAAVDDDGLIFVWDIEAGREINRTYMFKNPY